MKYLIITIILYTNFFNNSLFASEKKIIELAESHIKNHEYYNAITELMRYQYFYPGGVLYPKSLLLMGEAYFSGGNYFNAIESMKNCHKEFPQKPEGEEALYRIAHLRLVTGSAFFAYRTFQSYQYIYKNGVFSEDVNAERCYSLALINEFDDALSAISEYKNTYKNGKYISGINELENMVISERDRPKKSLWVAVTGSAILPGFGHIYTGNYSTGIFSFFTNALLIFLAYDGYRDDNKFRFIFFTLMEITFYQHSLIGAINDVYRYNSRENFQRDVRLGIKKTF